MWQVQPETLRWTRGWTGILNRQGWKKRLQNTKEWSICVRVTALPHSIHKCVYVCVWDRLIRVFPTAWAKYLPGYSSQRMVIEIIRFQFIRKLFIGHILSKEKTFLLNHGWGIMQIRVYNCYENWNVLILVDRIVSRYTHESVVNTHSVLPNIGESVKKKRRSPD